MAQATAHKEIIIPLAPQDFDPQAASHYLNLAILKGWGAWVKGVRYSAGELDEAIANDQVKDGESITALIIPPSEVNAPTAFEYITQVIESDTTSDEVRQFAESILLVHYAGDYGDAEQDKILDEPDAVYKVIKTYE